MKICIYGAGAIGGYLSVELALAGFEWEQLLGLDGLFHDDADGDGLPDDVFTLL